MEAMKRFLKSKIGGRVMKTSFYAWYLVWTLVIFQAVAGDSSPLVRAVHADAPPPAAPVVPPGGAVAEIQKIVTGIEKAESQVVAGRSQLEAILDELSKLLDKPVAPPLPSDPPVPTPAPAPGTVKIVGPSSVKLDQSAIFKVPLEFAGAEYDWTVEPPVDNSVDGSNRKETFFVLQNVTKPVYFISFVSWDKKVSTLHRLTVIGGTDDVSPDGPPVDDPTKDDRFGMAKVVRDLVAKVPAASRAKLNGVSKMYRDLQTSIAGGKDWGAPTDQFNDFKLQMIGKFLREQNKFDGDEWTPVKEGVNQSIAKLYSGGQLKTLGDFGDCIGGVALGWEQMKL